MPEPKAQLVDPQGPIDVPGISATGIITATGGFVGAVQGAATGLANTTINLTVGVVTSTGFVGDVTGTASSVTKGANLSLGIVTATSFTGDLTGNAVGLSTTTAGLKLGIVTSTTFAGNFTGMGSGITGTPHIQAGIMTATSFAGNFTGLASGITGSPNIMVGVLTGTSFSGDGSSLTGIAATNWITNNVTTTSATAYAINVTASGSSAYTLSGNDRNGSVSGSDPSVVVNVGDTLNFAVNASGHPFYIRVSDGGANVSTPAATNQGTQSGTVSWTPNTAGTYYYQCGNHAGMIGTITVSDSTTLINLSLGNVVKFTQNVSTTVSFANTGTSNIVTFIRVKDDTSTERTITWPSAVKWNNGREPTLLSGPYSNDAQQFQLLTRDEGVTWYGWETVELEGGYQLWGWGNNEVGQLGIDSVVDYSSPVQIGTEKRWTGIYGKTSSASGQNMAVRAAAGTLWVAGQNFYGQLGLNTQSSPGYHGRSSPTQIPGTTWANACNCEDGMMAVRTDGSLWVWGTNEYGQLGQNERTQRSSPTQLPGSWSTSENHMAMSKNTRLAIKSDGTLWGWGHHYYGSLAQNAPSKYYSSPVQVPGTTWNYLAKAANTTFAMKTDGTTWGWGNNQYGNLGQNENESSNTTAANYSSPIQISGNWTNINCAAVSFFGVKTDGTGWAWGVNGVGQLGLNEGGPSYAGAKSSPTQLPGTNWKWFSPQSRDGEGSADGTVALKTDGTMWSWGTSNTGQLGLGQAFNPWDAKSSPVQIPGTNWLEVASGDKSSIALRSD